MNRYSVYCIANSRTQAEDIVNGLKEGMFSEPDISVLFFDKKSTTEFSFATTAKRDSGGMNIGAGMGSVIGGTLGWIAGIGLLNVPGASPVVADGPLTATLSGVAAGALAGGLIGLGIAEVEAGREERSMTSGSILIGAHAQNIAQITYAMEVFMKEGAGDIFRKEEAGDIIRRTDAAMSTNQPMASSH